MELHTAPYPDSIYADSNCGKRYKEARPEDLATELEGGLRNREAVSDTPITMDDRHGVQRVTRGEFQTGGSSTCCGTVP
jgi:hypothetical protein